MGVMKAALRFTGVNLVNETWLEGNLAEVLAVVAVALRADPLKTWLKLPIVIGALDFVMVRVPVLVMTK